MTCRNRLEYWRLQLAAKRGMEITKKDMAVFLRVDYGQYKKWAWQNNQPGAESLLQLWKRLRGEYPELNMQDLLEDAPD